MLCSAIVYECSAHVRIWNISHEVVGSSIVYFFFAYSTVVYECSTYVWVYNIISEVVGSSIVCSIVYICGVYVGVCNVFSEVDCPTMFCFIVNESSIDITVWNCIAGIDGPTIVYSFSVLQCNVGYIDWSCSYMEYFCFFFSIYYKSVTVNCYIFIYRNHVYCVKFVVVCVVTF